MNTFEEELQAYWAGLAPIESDPVFLTDRTDRVRQETDCNCWSLGIIPELAQAVSAADVLNFLRRVRAGRQRQLEASEWKIGLIYYLWFDAAAGTLRFCFINSNHAGLPFGGEIRPAASECSVVEQFLAASRAGAGIGIPLDEMEEIDFDEAESEAEAEPEAVEVFSMVIEKNVPPR